MQKKKTGCHKYLKNQICKHLKGKEKKLRSRYHYNKQLKQGGVLALTKSPGLTLPTQAPTQLPSTAALCGASLTFSRRHQDPALIRPKPEPETQAGKEALVGVGVGLAPSPAYTELRTVAHWTDHLSKP